ncbi:FkbM family methyltransferase [Xanthomarina sp. F2636L]|uniref:FkbM family methyltransferase n=1 Tax=Xanthomarina sp. F2636L TaxID=2996018 RepID=UPI00225DF82C|nr:FkbM family methyltransferase [Xanthomarina sp. F2636L]MCX7549357.1 FkbM family methyltransferase [Xanthomarina sp. F2636L]
MNKLGYSKAETQSLNSHKVSLLETLFVNVKKMGFSPKHIIDVGANHGVWTRETLKHFPDAYYSLLEPQEWLQASFQDLLNSNSKIKVHAVGAGAKTGNFLFTVTNRDDSSSFRYTKEEAETEGFKQIEIPVITLNELVKKTPNLPLPDLIKIDAEGLDIDVLKGADSLFGKTEIFMVEASVNCKMFENSVLNMINFMDESGYTLFDITDLNRPFHPNVLWLVELAFIKKGGVLDYYKMKIKI